MKVMELLNLNFGTNWPDIDLVSTPEPHVNGLEKILHLIKFKREMKKYNFRSKSEGLMIRKSR